MIKGCQDRKILIKNIIFITDIFIINFNYFCHIFHEKFPTSFRKNFSLNFYSKDVISEKNVNLNLMFALFKIENPKPSYYNLLLGSKQPGNFWQEIMKNPAITFPKTPQSL